MKFISFQVQLNLRQSSDKQSQFTRIIANQVNEWMVTNEWFRWKLQHSEVRYHTWIQRWGHACNFIIHRD